MCDIERESNDNMNNNRKHNGYAVMYDEMKGIISKFSNNIKFITRIIVIIMSRAI